ncbi:tRNA (guanine(9)-N(1))-methyltransferase [Linnemannia gamsii]|uniref:tRNA (guanine(9)-N1)-methyltransferase n=1 Tax=Linnemannia gamsii TaxID=64522 RepID=A0A9P6UH27_9FUNG|nr:tRNA (guanine(9)-N(1))-methyltransferase [Linnemannia gamsii]
MSEPLESDHQEKMVIEGGAAAAALIAGTEGTGGSEAIQDTTATLTTNTSDQPNTTTSHNSNDNNGNSNPNNPFWKPRAPPMMGPDGKPLSRNATKKLLKQQQFLERRPQMRAQEKLKRKLKDQKRREAIDAGLIAPPPKRQKLDQIQSGITIGIDMAFDDLMLEKEVKSMVDQIKRCYSHNRTCEKIVHLALTSFTGQSRKEFDKRANGFELWRNFTIHDKSLEEVWPSEEIPGSVRIEELKKLQVIASAKSEAAKAKALAASAAAAASDATNSTSENSSTDIQASGSSLTPVIDATNPTIATTTVTLTEGPSAEEIKILEAERALKEESLATTPAVKKVVYLSADSPNTITELDPGTCYILGGIVDKNRFPNLCQSKAEKLGIETAQLPIGEYIQMSSRRVLTVNQVFEILLQFIECNDWKEAFLKVIPQRKLEEKQRIRRGTEAWRKKYGEGAGTGRPSNGGSGTNSVTSSVAGDESNLYSEDGDNDDDNDIDYDEGEDDVDSIVEGTKE